MQNRAYRLPIIATLVTLLAVVIMFALGIWQLQRAEQKTQRLQLIKHAQQSAQIGVSKVAEDPQNNQDMPINFVGTADSEKYFLLDNKIHQGRVGYQVIVPVQTTQGHVLVNYGWLAATNSRQQLPAVTIESSILNFSGIVWLPSKNILVKETAKLDGNWPKVIQAVDLDLLAQHYGSSFLPFVVKLSPSPDSDYVRVWQAVVMPPEKHFAYAVQWFLLAVAAIVIFVVAQLKNKQRNKSEYSD